MRCILLMIAVLFYITGLQAQGKLVFREDWKEIPAALPVTPDHVKNVDLELNLYGPGRGEIKKSNHPEIPNDPYYIWSGECRSNWGLALRHRTAAIDMRGDAKVRIRSRQSGFRQLRIMLKLVDGTWLVSDQGAGFSQDWREEDFMIRDIRWRKLDIERVTETAWVENPDLSRVEEVGFTDLMSGGGTPASSRVDWIEVYGIPVNR